MLSTSLVARRGAYSLSAATARTPTGEHAGEHAQSQRLRTEHGLSEVYIYIYIYICMYASVYMYVCMPVYECMYVCMYVYMSMD
jgi:hypothetical protein